MLGVSNRGALPLVRHDRGRVRPVVLHERADDVVERDALRADAEADERDEREDDKSGDERTHS